MVNNTVNNTLKAHQCEVSPHDLQECMTMQTCMLAYVQRSHHCATNISTERAAALPLAISTFPSVEAYWAPVLVLACHPLSQAKA
jgi:hypothetical protein